MKREDFYDNLDKLDWYAARAKGAPFEAMHRFVQGRNEIREVEQVLQSRPQVRQEIERTR